MSAHSILMDMTMITERMTMKTAAANAGAISVRNSKMPGTSFAISAKHCKVGGKLAAIKDSVCSKCYALKIQGMRPSVNEGWTNNYLKATRMIAEAPEAWAKAMAFQINTKAGKGAPFHRWFDSGDLQSLEMLRAIALTCELTPKVSHWLPTREAAIVKAYGETYGALPSNLTVRVSSTMIGDAPRTNYGNTSTVHRKGSAPAGHVCPASTQGNACGECRACWDKSVPNVSYPLH